MKDPSAQPAPLPSLGLPIGPRRPQSASGTHREALQAHTTRERR